MKLRSGGIYELFSVQVFCVAKGKVERVTGVHAKTVYSPAGRGGAVPVTPRPSHAGRPDSGGRVLRAARTAGLLGHEVCVGLPAT